MKFNKKSLLLLSIIFSSFQVSAMTDSDVNKCFSKRENYHLNLFDNSSRNYSMPEIMKAAILKIEEAKDCDDLKAKMKPMIDDLKKVISIDLKYKLQFKEETKKDMDELKKVRNEPNLPEDVSDDIVFMDLIEASTKNLEDSNECSFNKGISIQCPEGFYKYVGSENLKNVSSKARKSKHVINPAESVRSTGNSSVQK